MDHAKPVNIITDGVNLSRSENTLSALCIHVLEGDSGCVFKSNLISADHMAATCNNLITHISSYRGELSDNRYG